MFTGWPCAACLDQAAAELDLAGHTQRALPWDSNSPRRKPLVESSCSARLMGERQTPYDRPKASILFSARSTQHSLFPFLFFYGLTTHRRLTQVATGSGFVTQVPTAGIFFCTSSCTKLYSAIFVSSATFSVESQE